MPDNYYYLWLFLEVSLGQLGPPVPSVAEQNHWRLMEWGFIGQKSFLPPNHQCQKGCCSLYVNTSTFYPQCTSNLTIPLTYLIPLEALEWVFKC